MAKAKKAAKKSKEEGSQLRTNSQKWILLAVVAVVLIVIIYFVATNLPGEKIEETPKIKDDPLVIDNTYTVTRWEHSGLRDSIKFEYRALEITEEAMAKVGEVEPFKTIREEKLKNIEILNEFFIVHELDLLGNIWDGKVTVPDDMKDLCLVGKQNEQKTIAIHENILRTAENPQLIRAITEMRDQAKNEHLSLYEACD